MPAFHSETGIQRFKEGLRLTPLLFQVHHPALIGLVKVCLVLMRTERHLILFLGCSPFRLRWKNKPHATLKEKIIPGPVDEDD